MSANEALISQYGGYLAPYTGDERYVTVGCGHTVAFCKQASIGGKTPSKDLQDDQGRIDRQKVCKDPVFASMIQDGWQWTHQVMRRRGISAVR